jgi:uncharacterized membrane protein
VVVSDGCANRHAGEAEAAARNLAHRGVPVHAVVAGSEAPAGGVRDVAVRGLRAPDRVFAGNRAEVRATVAALGLQGTDVEAVLTVNGREAGRRRLSPGSAQTSDEVVFAPALEEAGAARLALAVAPLEGELVTANNRAEATVRVQEGGIRALYLSGRLHPEGKYLARVLGDAREVDLSRRLLVGAGADAAAPQPADLDAVDVLVLGDLPAAALPPATVERIADRVRAGDLSLLTLGGREAYGPGGWGDTPVAGVLPFAINASDGVVDGPVVFGPTAEGREHFVFRGEDGEAAPSADVLPPLAAANAVGDLVPAARLLAAAAGGEPLLAVREFGDGRVASVTFDTTWRWALAPEQTGGPAMQRRLWQRLVLWLARRDGRPRDDLWVATDRTQYVVTDRARPPVAEVTVGVRGQEPPALRLEGPVPVAVRLARLGAGGEARSEWRGTVPLREPGEYTVRAEAAVDGRPQQAEAQVTVAEHDFELASLLADAARLGRVAEAGGGTCRRLDDLPQVLASLAASLEPQEVPVPRRLALARGPVFLAVLVGLVAAEWVLRRVWGLA